MQRAAQGVGFVLLGTILLGTTFSVAQERLPPPGASRPRPQQGGAQAPAKSGRVAVRFDPVAETRLLMEGLAQPNFRSLTRTLKNKPADDEAWAFARGQSLLIAETGNLLLLRPPRNQGRDAWMQRAMQMREAAAALSRLLSAKDLEQSRAGLAALAVTCNRCHQTFRIPVRIGPEIAAEGDAEQPPENPSRP